MGKEAHCKAHYAGKVSEGKALLESDALIFRGDFRILIPRRQITLVEAGSGKLTVGFAEGIASFDLGSSAEKWAQEIRNPRTLLDKLGVKQDSIVAVLGIEDQNFREQLADRVADISTGRPKKDSDLIFLGAERKEDLAKLGRLKKYLKPSGAIWVVWPKGRSQLKESDVMAAGKAAGLVDVKVASFSETHSALKLVIPLKQR